MSRRPRLPFDNECSEACKLHASGVPSSWHAGASSKQVEVLRHARRRRWSRRLASGHQVDVVTGCDEPGRGLRSHLPDPKHRNQYRTPALNQVTHTHSVGDRVQGRPLAHARSLATTGDRLAEDPRSDSGRNDPSDIGHSIARGEAYFSDPWVVTADSAGTRPDNFDR